ncbi:hypothetical protein K0A96_01285 [Patescibacteria group bacterium]|nr:hypothetical protein [Patescibacteria group bacterium]
MTKIKKIANRIHGRYLERYRSCSTFTKKIDRTMIAVGLVGSISTITQIVYIATTKNVGGISLYSWFGYLFVTFSWFMYGFLHKSKPLIAVNFIGLITNSTIIFQYFILT